MADDNDNGGRKPRRRASSKLVKTSERLLHEMREAYAVAGVELSPEAQRERMQVALDRMWFTHAVKQLCDAVELPHSYVELADADNDRTAPTQAGEDDDD